MFSPKVVGFEDGHILVEVLGETKRIARPSWPEMHMRVAIVGPGRYSCLKRSVGAVFVKGKTVISSGYNGAAAGQTSCRELGFCYYDDLAYRESRRREVEFDEDFRERHKMYCIAVHAEHNAQAHISRLGGVALEGSSVYITNFPCPACTQGVIVSNKITEVVYWRDYLCNELLTMDERRASEKKLNEAGVPFRQLNLTEERLFGLFLLDSTVGNRSGYVFLPPS